MKQCLVIALMILTLGFNCVAQENISVDLAPFQESIRAQLEELELGQLLGFKERLEREYQEYLPGLTWRDFLAGGGAAMPGELFALVLRNFFRELYLSLYLVRQLVVVGILAALLQRLSSSFGIKTVVDLAFGVCFLVLMLIGLQSFKVVSAVAIDAVDQMVEFMHALLPILSTLLIAVGGVTSATIFHPLLWGLTSTIASLVQYLLFPLILFSTAFNLASHFSPDLPFSKLGHLLRQGVITLLGIFFVVFSGFMVVRGAIAPVADGISLRAAKYLTKTLIPIAGGMFADALEVVVGGSLLIKNGVGVFGLMMVMFLVAAPLLKVWAMVLVYKLVGALLEPICDHRFVQTLGTMESSLTLVFIALGTVAVMFLLSITILVSIGNLAVFMR